MENIFFKLNGASFRDLPSREAIAAAQPGDEVTIVPEPTNPYDPNALQVHIGPFHVGYVAKDACLDVMNALALNPALRPVIRSKIGTLSALVELREPVALTS